MEKDFIIQSLLDSDFYKFSMGQAALNQFSTTSVKYAFKCRNDAKWTPALLEEIQEEIAHYCTLRFTEEELDYLASIYFIKKSYIDFLGLYQPNLKHIKAWLTEKQELQIEVEGPWYLTIFFEVPVLAIVNEVYFRNLLKGRDKGDLFKDGNTRLNEKIVKANEAYLPFADFGTRRRISRKWQDHVVEVLSKKSKRFVGTSNVLLAMKYGVKPIGTMAHEYIQAGAGQENVRLVKSQAFMLQKWVDEYRGSLGIALTDTYGFDAFLRDFDGYFAKLYDGLRHDSGDPFEWAEKAIAHYTALNIDTRTKSLVFSDGLDMDIAISLYQTFKSRINVSFGIGTNLTNDFAGVTPLQIVMKIVECNGYPVAKVSDSPGKEMCRDPAFVGYVRKVFEIK